MLPKRLKKGAKGAKGAKRGSSSW